MQNFGYGREATHAEAEFCLHPGLVPGENCRQAAWPAISMCNLKARVSHKAWMSTVRTACKSSLHYLCQQPMCSTMTSCVPTPAPPVEALCYLASARITTMHIHMQHLLSAVLPGRLSVLVSVKLSLWCSVRAAGALREALLIGYDLPRMEGLWPSEKQCPGFKYASPAQSLNDLEVTACQCCCHTVHYQCSMSNIMGSEVYSVYALQMCSFRCNRNNSTSSTEWYNLSICVTKFPMHTADHSCTHWIHCVSRVESSDTR